jgi:DNA polymerase-4
LTKTVSRILHFDADNFFATCEEILSPAFRGQALIVSGGRRQNGFVLSANRRAKQLGIKNGVACFAARRLCAELVMCPARPDEYRQISARMFAVMNRFSPLVVPVSIDEGFLDLSAEADGAARWRELSATVSREVGLNLSGGLANSRWLAKLATDAAKPGFLEVAAGREKEFLSPRDLRELSGIGEHRANALVALGARTFGDVAALPSMLLRQCFGIWGQKLFLFASGQWQEKLVAEARTRTMISRQKTFSFDVRDYERVRQFGLVELKKLLAQLRREQLAPREISVAVRFADFSEVAARHLFRAAQERDELLSEMFAAKFAECVAGQTKLVRQLRLALGALSPMAARQEVFGDW